MDIELINHIEDDDDIGMSREELMAEQHALKQEMIRQLERQRQMSLSSRLARRQRVDEEQEAAELRWKQIQVRCFPET